MKLNKFKFINHPKIKQNPKYILGLFIACGIGVFIGSTLTTIKKMETPKIVESTVVDDDSVSETIDEITWKTYKNSELNFQFDYPSNTEVRESSDALFVSFINTCIDFSVVKTSLIDSYQDDITNKDIFSLYPDFEKLLIGEKLTKEDPDFSSNPDFVFTETFTRLEDTLIDGHMWLTVLRENNYEGIGNDYHYFHSQYGFLYMINFMESDALCAESYTDENGQFYLNQDKEKQILESFQIN